MPRLIQDGLVPGGGGGGGASTGDLSAQVPFVEDWVAVGGPDAGTKGNFSTLDFDPITDEGIFFDWQVPDDYDSGNIEVVTVYAMAGAELSKTLIFAWQADIIELDTGTIDNSTYASPTSQTINTANDTLLHDTRGNGTLIEIIEGDFQAGDKIQFRIKRDATTDTHGQDCQVVGWIVKYTGAVSNRVATQDIVLFEDTDETPPGAGTKGSFATIDFSGSSDEEQKFTFVVPDNWDGTSDGMVRFLYAMSSAGSSDYVTLSTEGQLGDISTGLLDTLGVVDCDVWVPDDTNIHRTVSVRGIPASEIAAGDTVVLKIKRKGSSDSHTGDWKMISATVTFGVAPASGWEQIVIEEHYLYAYDFAVVAGSPTNAQESPTYSSGNFETWMKMTSTTGSDQVKVSFQGRLMSTQSQISTIKIPVMASHADATLTYAVRVYVEDGTLATPAYNPGAVSASGTSRFVVSLTSTDLGGRQPDFDSGREGRFFVEVEMTATSASRVLRVGRPFVGLE